MFEVTNLLRYKAYMYVRTLRHVTFFLALQSAVTLALFNITTLKDHTI
jgi:hypothetical protein